MDSSCKMFVRPSTEFCGIIKIARCEGRNLWSRFTVVWEVCMDCVESLCGMHDGHTVYCCLSQPQQQGGGQYRCFDRLKSW